MFSGYFGSSKWLNWFRISDPSFKFIAFTNTIIEEPFLKVFVKYGMGNILLVNCDLKGKWLFGGNSK